MWDLPGPGLEPVSPALAGGFLITAPPGKPWEVLLDADGLHFLHQEVHLVEEQDDGDEEELVVNDGLKDAHGLRQAAGAPVLREDLVVLTGRDHEQDQGDSIKALEPLLALRPLAAHIHHLERYFFNDKVMIHDALGGLPRQQDVLLARESNSAGQSGPSYPGSTSLIHPAETPSSGWLKASLMPESLQSQSEQIHTAERRQTPWAALLCSQRP